MRTTSKLFISSAILMLLACGGAGSQIDDSSTGSSANNAGTGSIQTGDGGNSSSVGGGSSGSVGGINSGNSDGGTLDGPVGGGTSDGLGGSGGTLDGSGSDTSSGGTSDGLGGTGDNVGGTLTSDGEGGTGGTDDGVGGSGASDDGVGGSGGTLDGIGGSGATGDGLGGIGGGTSDNVGGSGATGDGVIIAPPPVVPPPPVGGTEDNVGGTGNTTDNIGGSGNTADAIPTAPPPPPPPPANTNDNVDGGVTSDCPSSCPPEINGGGGNGGTNGFNTIVLNDAVLENVDTQGRMYVGNNFTTPGYTVGSNMPYSTTRMDLIVGNNLTVQASSSLWGLTVQNGLIAYGGSITGQEYININLTAPVAGTPPGVVYSKPMVPAEVTADMRAWSTSLAALTATGSVSGSTFFCGSEPLCVIFASPSNLTSAVTVSAPTGTMVVINVNGTSATMSNYAVTLQGGTVKNNVLYNFYQATNLSVSAISVQGSVLAPLADLYFTNANIEGQVIVNNWVMPAGVTAGEIHDYLLYSCPELCP